MNVIHASFALEAIVRVALGVLVEREQIAQLANAEMSLHVLFVVDHTTAQRFFVRLTLKDLLFEGAR